MATSKRHEVNVVIRGREHPMLAEIGTNRMILESGLRLPYGTEVRVRFQGLDIPVTVRWSSGTEIGVQCGLLRARDVWSIHRLFAADRQRVSVGPTVAFA